MPYQDSSGNWINTPEDIAQIEADRRAVLEQQYGTTDPGVVASIQAQALPNNLAATQARATVAAQTRAPGQAAPTAAQYLADEQDAGRVARPAPAASAPRRPVQQTQQTGEYVNPFVGPDGRPTVSQARDANGRMTLVGSGGRPILDTPGNRQALEGLKLSGWSFQDELAFANEQELTAYDQSNGVTEPPIDSPVHGEGPHTRVGDPIPTNTPVPEPGMNTPPPSWLDPSRPLPRPWQRSVQQPQPQPARPNTGPGQGGPGRPRTRPSQDEIDAGGRMGWGPDRIYAPEPGGGFGFDFGAGYGDGGYEPDYSGYPGGGGGQPQQPQQPNYDDVIRRAIEDAMAQYAPPTGTRQPGQSFRQYMPEVPDDEYTYQGGSYAGMPSGMTPYQQGAPPWSYGGQQQRTRGFDVSAYDGMDGGDDQWGGDGYDQADPYSQQYGQGAQLGGGYRPPSFGGRYGSQGGGYVPWGGGYGQQGGDGYGQQNEWGYGVQQGGDGYGQQNEWGYGVQQGGGQGEMWSSRGEAQQFNPPQIGGQQASPPTGAPTQGQLDQYRQEGTMGRPQPQGVGPIATVQDQTPAAAPAYDAKNPPTPQSVTSVVPQPSIHGDVVQQSYVGPDGRPTTDPNAGQQWQQDQQRNAQEQQRRAQQEQAQSLSQMPSPQPQQYTPPQLGGQNQSQQQYRERQHIGPMARRAVPASQALQWDLYRGPSQQQNAGYTRTGAPVRAGSTGQALPFQQFGTSRYQPPRMGQQSARPQTQQRGYSTSAQSYARNLPAPNQIAGRNWMKMPRSTQQFLLGGYESAGYSGDDVEHAVRRGLPQFRAPTFGSVR